MIFTVDSDLNRDGLQFTFTCTSTGGPVTNVTWTRDSETVSGGMTVFNNAITAQYTHTLTVTGRLGGQYQCNVANNKPSEATANFTVQGKATMSHMPKCDFYIANPQSHPSPPSILHSFFLLLFLLLPFLLLILCLNLFQLPQLQLASLHSRKIPLVSESLGHHPLH